MTIAQRLWSRVDKSAGPAGCWPWTGPVKETGYSGWFWFDKTHGYLHAHKAAFLLGGTLSEDTPHVLHKCHEFGLLDNRLCCNPLHLRAGTHSENVRDSVRVRTHRDSRKTHCPKGHPLSGDNLYIRPADRNGSSGQYARRCKICLEASAKTTSRKAYAAAWQRERRKKARYDP